MNKLKKGEVPIWCAKCEKYLKYLSPYEIGCKDNYLPASELNDFIKDPIKAQRLYGKRPINRF